MPTAFEVASYNGNKYGIAIGIEASFLLYRKDMFREAGLDPQNPPKNWDELLEYAEKLTVRDGDTVTRAGFSIPTSAGHSTFTVSYTHLFRFRITVSPSSSFFPTDTICDNWVGTITIISRFTICFI